ncbi:Transmembrane protein [Melia azedarach]|uniref:Transmembrane protein n=1 Tax=Melia azedarach TaxID=155640 RepID=A0ACC1YUT0_MELAZ|nr:Transmembrane protein [Melia azedarach]
MLQTHHLPSSTFPFYLSHHPKKLNFLLKPAISLSVFPRPSPVIVDRWLAQAQEPTTTAATSSADPEEGPIQLTQSIFATTDDPSPLQVSTSVLLTGAIFVFLFRSLRRRAKRAKELKFRSTGAKKSLKEEALDNLKAMGSSSIEAKAPPSPAEALLGAISAGVIALILYKFTTTVEAALNRQTVSDNFSVRQITITIRTIVNGLCYLATFVFGINSIGLFLYSGQLVLNSFMEDSNSNETDKEGEQQSGVLKSTAENARDSIESNSSKED